MSSIIARGSDTFERVSRQAYGAPSGALQIAQANPGVSEPIPGGTLLTIPPQLGAVRDKVAPAEGVGLDDVAVLVQGARFRVWDSIIIHRAIDSAPSMQLNAVWEPENAELRRVFRPMSFHQTEVFIGGRPAFRGVTLTPAPVTDPSTSEIGIQSYGVTGVLTDCTASSAAYPVSFNSGQDLKAIAEYLLKPFGIGVQFDVSPGPPFEELELGISDKILGFLVDLAKQRNIVIGETAEGKLLFQRSTAGGEPVAVFSGDAPPSVNVEAIFSGQNMYSSVTGVSPSLPGLPGDKYTVKNPHVTNVFRPFTFSADDSGNASLPELVRAKAGRMFGNAVSWLVTVPTWRDSRDALWEPNTTVMLHAPRAMIFKETELLIRRVTLRAAANARTAELLLVLPGAFAGVMPKVLPWDE